jgi:hypothetical protein
LINEGIKIGLWFILFQYQICQVYLNDKIDLEKAFVEKFYENTEI